MDRFSEEDDFHETRKELKAHRKMVSKRDRSKFKKTDREKLSRHQKTESEKKLSKKELLRGRVLDIYPEGGVVVDHDGLIYTCVLRGILKKEQSRQKNLVAVGDFVLFESSEGEVATISHIEERTSILSRQEHLRRRQEQIIAANIDQVLITASIADPPLKPALIDRYIIATKKGNMLPVIVLNKIDLLHPHSSEYLLFESFLNTYQCLNIPVIPLSIHTGEGIEALKKCMQGKASVFSGQSGVGKSSLINAITGLSLPVGDVAKKTRKGSHTTTRAHLIPLPFGGWCIDTPGIRSFGVWDLKKEDLAAYFPEIQAIGRTCYYPNCTHAHEPGCAVEAALEKGEISPLRFDSYSKLLEEI